MSGHDSKGQEQPPGKIPRIGVLVPAEPDSPDEPHVGGFRQGLRDLGYAEGRNIVVEYRYAHGKAEAYPVLATELVRLNVDIMVVGSTAPTRAAKAATSTIPIVGVGMATDPIAAGLVVSLNRPGGNVTGVTYATGAEHYQKCLQLLREAAPHVTRVAWLRYARVALNPTYLSALQTAAQALGMRLEAREVREVDEFDRLLAELSKNPGGAFFVGAEPRFFPHRSRLPELAAKYRLPAIYNATVFADAGD